MSNYFDSGTRSTERFRTLAASELPTVQLGEGITADVLLGERLNINVVTLGPNVLAPVHTHAEEQMGYVVRGSCDFIDAERTVRLEAGDTYHALPGAPHGARAHADGCLIIDVFSPPRSGLADMVARAARS